MHAITHACLHTPKTSETCFITHVSHFEDVSQMCGVFNRFSGLNITQK